MTNPIPLCYDMVVYLSEKIDCQEPFSPTEAKLANILIELLKEKGLLATKGELT